MEKRDRGSYNSGWEPHAAKRQRTPAAHPEDLDALGDGVEAEWFIEQRLVGWIIGKAGATLKEIQAGFDVKVKVDQSTKAEGYSKVLVAGPSANVHSAAEHMNSSLARASGDLSGDASAGPFLLELPPVVETNAQYGGADLGFEEITIEQQFVGWLLGKGGGVVRDIEQQSGCKVSINQDTRAQGYSRLRINGSTDQRQYARSMIDASLERAAQNGSAAFKGGGGGCPRGAPSKGGAVTPGQPMFTLQSGGSSPTLQATGNGFTVTIGGGSKGGNAFREDQIQVEQKWVGYLLGKGGGLCKEIERETGCRIKIDQSTRDQGFSTVRIEGMGGQVGTAKHFVMQKLSQVGGAALAGSAGETNIQVQIEQKWVGWLLGKAGTVLKEMEYASGAKIAIDQETKEMGYSVALISGTSAQIESGYSLMYGKIAQVDPEAASRLVQLDTGGLEGGAAPDDGLGLGLGPAAAPSKLLTPKMKGPTTPIGAPAPAQRWPSSAGAASGSHSVELQVEQRCVGWLLGSGGKTVKQMEAKTGCRIVCDQSTKELGYSTVKVTGAPGAVQAALDTIQTSLAMADKGETPGAHGVAGGDTEEAEELTVEQQKVGWLLGKGGVVLREIETNSGARCKLDQSTKELGFSTVRISGSSYGIESARRLIEEKIARASAFS